jgi:hypothetical protein
MPIPDPDRKKKKGLRRTKKMMPIKRNKMVKKMKKR